MTDQEIGEKLKEYRERNKITQEELARALDIPTITISRWERGLNVSKAYRKILKHAGMI
ncbi:helix-turn-helix domain-containing protein [Candidatus Omnitrophota bacterium]